MHDSWNTPITDEYELKPVEGNDGVYQLTIDLDAGVYSAGFSVSVPGPGCSGSGSGALTPTNVTPNVLFAYEKEKHTLRFGCARYAVRLCIYGVRKER